MKEDEKENLDEEIESAVDSLFVEMGADGGLELEGSQREIAEKAEPIPDITPEVMEESFPEQAEPIPDITPEVMEEPLERGEPAEAALELEPIREEAASVPEAELIPDITPEVMEEPLERGEPAEAALELEPIKEETAPVPEAEPIREEIPPSPAESKPIQKPPEEEKLPKGLETMEVEILSLEWEFSPEILKKIIAALGGLKATYRGDDSLLKIIDMMGKVSLYLLNDERSITPEALRFLQDGKEVLKFLTTEKGEQTIFKNLMVDGINSHFQLLGLDRGVGRDKAQDEIFQRLCSDLEKHRMKLYDGEDRLGRALNRVQGMKDELIFDDGIRGLSDELEKIHGYLRMYLGRLGGISEEFQKEMFGQRLYKVERVLLVEVQNRFFGIPDNSVMKSYSLAESNARNIAGQDSITIRGRRVPLVKLSRVFKLGATGEGRPHGIVLVGKKEPTIGILVDRVLRNKDLFMKTAEQETKGSRYIAGLSHLESGKTVYILNIERLKARS